MTAADLARATQLTALLRRLGAERREVEQQIREQVADALLAAAAEKPAGLTPDEAATRRYWLRVAADIAQGGEDRG